MDREDRVVVLLVALLIAFVALVWIFSTLLAKLATAPAPTVYPTFVDGVHCLAEDATLIACDWTRDD